MHTLRDTLTALQGLPANPFVAQAVRQRWGHGLRLRLEMLGFVAAFTALTTIPDDLNAQASAISLSYAGTVMATMALTLAGLLGAVSQAIRLGSRTPTLPEGPPMSGREQALGRWLAALLPSLDVWLVVLLAALARHGYAFVMLGLAQDEGILMTVAGLPVLWGCWAALGLRVAVLSKSSSAALAALLVTSLTLAALGFSGDVLQVLGTLSHQDPSWGFFPLVYYPLSPYAACWSSLNLGPSWGGYFACLGYWVAWTWLLLRGAIEVLASAAEPCAVPSPLPDAPSAQPGLTALLVLEALPLLAAGQCCNGLLSSYRSTRPWLHDIAPVVALSVGWWAAVRLVMWAALRLTQHLAALCWGRPGHEASLPGTNHPSGPGEGR